MFPSQENYCSTVYNFLYILCFHYNLSEVFKISFFWLKNMLWKKKMKLFNICSTSQKGIIFGNLLPFSPNLFQFLTPHPSIIMFYSFLSTDTDRKAIITNLGVVGTSEIGYISCLLSRRKILEVYNEEEISAETSGFVKSSCMSELQKLICWVKS